MHDVKNALLFLETFPLILKQLSKTDPDYEKQRDELIEVYVEKIAVVKAFVDKK